MTRSRKYLILLMGLASLGMGLSLTMKAAVGISAFDAFGQTLAYTLNIRVGNSAMTLQTIFVLLQLAILRRDADWKLFLQIPVAVILGQFINLFFYGVFGGLVIETYFSRLLIFILAQIWVSLSVAVIVHLDSITMPIESFSVLVSKITKFSFGQVRQGLDIFFIVIALLFTLIFSLPFTIREGSVISAIMFGPLLTYFAPKVEILFDKLNLNE